MTEQQMTNLAKLLHGRVKTMTYITTREAAYVFRLTRLKPSTLYVLARQGKLPVAYWEREPYFKNNEDTVRAFRTVERKYLRR